MNIISSNKIEKHTVPIESIVYDLQVEDNENFFVEVEDGEFALVHNCLLKPLEEPSKATLWVLCSMDPQKFTTGTGKAIANRCTQFVLEPHSDKDLFRQAMRIAKAERMRYVMDEDHTVLKQIVRNCNGEMRTVANLMQGLQQYYEGMDKPPKMLGKEDIAAVLATTESSEDKLAIRMMTAVYNCQYGEVQRCILDSSDCFQILNKLLYLNSYLLNSTILNGARHRKVWATSNNREFIKQLGKTEISLGMMAAANASLVEAKGMMMNFATSSEELLSARLYLLITEIKAMRK